jgi:hypothetical protein
MSAAVSFELPPWTPTEVPALAPPASTAAWSTRIGVPAAIRLGQMRRRVVGAIISAVFIPVGAYRILIGSRADPNATDSWGPADAFVIVVAILGVIGLVYFVQAARKQRANAVHSAQVILRQANPAVSDAQLGPLLSSTARFDAWAKQVNLIPLADNPVGSKASDEGSRLMFAQRSPGGYDVRAERFGTPVARMFRASRTEAWLGMILADAAILALAGGGVAAFILYQLGHPSALTVFTGGVLPLLLLFAVSMVLILLARYGRHGRYAIANAVLRELIERDPALTRRKVEALIARPYMYDLWVKKFGVPA